MEIPVKIKTIDQLFALFDKAGPVREVAEFIYKNLPRLLYYFHEVDLEIFNEKYQFYYYLVVEPNKNLWVRTLFPIYVPDMNFRELMIGVAGRIAFFSTDLANVEKKGKILTLKKDHPDKFYWYGEPINWARCLDVKFDSNGDVFSVTSREINAMWHEDYYEEEHYKKLNLELPDYLKYLFSIEYPIDIMELFLVYEEDCCNDFDIKMRCHLYTGSQLDSVSTMLEAYIKNIELNHGYTEKEAQLWYKFIKNRYRDRLQ